MSRRTTKTDEPSKASLAEMPEVDFSRLGRLSRGKYAERARRSLDAAPGPLLEPCTRVSQYFSARIAIVPR
jgi:hypothetical protein